MKIWKNKFLIISGAVLLVCACKSNNKEASLDDTFAELMEDQKEFSIEEEVFTENDETVLTEQEEEMDQQEIVIEEETTDEFDQSATASSEPEEVAELETEEQEFPSSEQ